MRIWNWSWRTWILMMMHWSWTVEMRQRILQRSFLMSKVKRIGFKNSFSLWFVFFFKLGWFGLWICRVHSGQFIYSWNQQLEAARIVKNVFVASHSDKSENYFKDVYVVKVTNSFTQLLKISKCKGRCLKSDCKEEWILYN